MPCGAPTPNPPYQARWRLPLALGTLGLQITGWRGRDLLGSDGFPWARFDGITLLGRQKEGRE